jgi:signal transduction histidine kinase
VTADPITTPPDPVAARLAVLAEASRIFAEARLNLSAVLDAVTRTVAATIGDQCVVRLVSDDGHWLVPVAMYHPDPDALALMRATLGAAPQRVDEGMLGEVMRTGVPLLIPEIDKQSAWASMKPEHRPYLDRFGMHSVLVVPVHLRGRIAGAIGIARDAPGRPYTDADRSLLVDLAGRAAQAIENARLYSEARAAGEQSRHHAARLQALAEASRAFAEAGLDAATVLDALARHLAQSVGDVCVIRLVSDDGRWLTPAALFHPDPDGSDLLRGLLAAVPHRADEGLNGRVMAAGQPLLLAAITPAEIRAATKPEYGAYLDRFPTSSLLMVAMRAHGRTLGTVTLMRHTSVAPYAAEDQLFLQELAGRAALAVENARLYAAEQAARAQADAAARRSTLLSEASSALAASLDFRATLTTVAGLAVPALADYCIVDIVAEDGRIERVAAQHADPDKAALIDELHRFPPTPGQESLPARAIHTGRTAQLTALSDTFLEDATRGPDHLRIVRALAPRSAMAVPLIARGRILGSILFALAGSAREYDAADLVLAEEIARRAALAVDNARLYEESGRALRLRDEFLSAVSHDLRTPLTTVRGFAQVLRRRLTRTGGEGSGWIDDGLANIETAASKMTGLVHELLDVARIQAGRPLDLTFKPADLVALARGAVADAARTAERHELRVEASVPQLAGRWDAPRLERVLANLLSNALKYSPDGGLITVTVEPFQEDGRDWACLSVRDQGIGIAERDLPHIFERFFRGANAKGIIDGVGIGLAGVRRIVEQHGGAIAVDSKEGSGATFTLRLPCGTDS